jgi:hypothetical protein
VPIQAEVDKANTILSVNLLMSKIRPQEEDTYDKTVPLKMLSITTFQNVTHTFSEYEVDIDSTVAKLKSI